jgi:hypothetical protein
MPIRTRVEFRAIRAQEDASCAALAVKWRIEAVGRDYPLYLTRAGDAVPGEWYLIRKGMRCKASRSQARELSRACSYGVYAIGPIRAVEFPKTEQSWRRPSVPGSAPAAPGSRAR